METIASSLPLVDRVRLKGSRDHRKGMTGEWAIPLNVSVSRVYAFEIFYIPNCSFGFRSDSFSSAGFQCSETAVKVKTN